jgi:hypothetical protein
MAVPFLNHCFLSFPQLLRWFHGADGDRQDVGFCLRVSGCCSVD